MMKGKFFSRFLRESSFLRQSLTLISGTVVAQGFSFVFLIVFQRFFFTPEHFGVLSVFTSFAGVFVAASTLKYEYAIVMAKTDEDALHLLILSLVCVLLVTGISFVSLAWFHDLSEDLPAGYVTFFMWTTPLAVLAGGAYESLSFWHNRYGGFSKISLARISQNVTTELSRLAIIPLNLGGKTLILGRVFGQLVSVLYLARHFFRKERVVRIDWRAIWWIARVNKDFPLFAMPTIFINNLTTWLFVYFFYETYGGSVIGMVSISIQYIALPFGILSSAFSQVFYRKIAAIERRADMLNVYVRFSKNLIMVGAAVIAIVFLIPDSLVVWVLGENWEGITTFMRTAVVWQTTAFVGSSLSFVYTRLLKQRLMVFYALLQLTLVYVSLSMGNRYLGTAEATFKLFVVCQSVYYVFAILSGYVFVKQSNILTDSASPGQGTDDSSRH